MIQIVVFRDEPTENHDPYLQPGFLNHREFQLNVKLSGTQLSTLSDRSAQQTDIVVSIVGHLEATESDISLRSWLKPKTEQKSQ